MISPLVTVLIVALVFYAIVPGIGAFGVRFRWRTFRRRVAEASMAPPLTYTSVRDRHPERSGGSRPTRFLGTLESIQGEDIVWVRAHDVTLAVDMSLSDLFLVPRSDSGYPEGPPTRTSWRRVGSLPEGLKVLVSGALDTSGAHPVIRAHADEPVLAVFYDGSDQSLVRRCIWSGRQLNEYWNSVTPGSLAGGVFALTILAYFLLRQPVTPLYARLSIALATVPILPLLPPGVLLFYFYRRGWRRGRILRAHRDVLRLPLRYFHADEPCTRLPSDELYCRRGAEQREIDEGATDGLVVLDVPVADPSGAGSSVGRRYTVFGSPRGEKLLAPDDRLVEWVAVRGDPVETSQACQRSARRYELLSLVILGAGMVVNMILIMIVVATLL